MIDNELRKLTIEFKNQYRSVKETFIKQKQMFDSTKNSTEDFFYEHYNSEQRLKMITSFKTSRCSRQQIIAMEELHNKITKDYGENFEEELCKQALFTFSNLVNEAQDIIENDTSMNQKQNALSSFFKKK
ncbi:hypothetical protein LKM13_24095 [Bacillus anthracis]|uniref:hypothetical protein n=1 Tax=Bacillus anthracis TaxID=1392 RepID=UPI001D0F1975|nr:hypothetical protein [Bacillus anthracis]MCC2347125.1 hypothetical protein [Bacillus anthracis]